MYCPSSTILLTIFLATNIILVTGIPWKSEQHKGTESKHQHLLNQTREYGQQIHAIFLGASIVERWLTDGKNIWKQYYSERHAFNYGISGDRTEHVLWRIEHGEFDGLQPKVIVIMIGSNNVPIGDIPSDIAKGIQMILKELLAKMNKSKILLLSVFPRGGESIDRKVAEVNNIIHDYQDNSRIFYLDVTKHFETNPGKIIEKYYVHDHLHLTEQGYQLWHKVMEPLFSKLLK
ncbi:platelet-activating factor acetylhydrolase IB subunit alpha2-like [Dermatophagoides pteronyssinus]|uniref:platelet-activating factor acetylhydrolase IB subunit alpha2-like n=1 Tax=Dermatophagoides pteronyssinus TaxID=6956 RepID=UPI003F6757E8